MGLLDGKVAIVTGAGHGIGRGHAMELARQGAKVVVNDVGGSVSGEGSGRDADLTVKIIEERGGEAVANYADVADYDAAGAMVQQAVDTWGQLDILVNNAGIVRDGAIWNMSESDFDAVMRVHVKGTWVPSHHAAKHWRARSKGGEGLTGRIINTTSGAGLVGNFGQTNYATAKAAIAGLTLTLSLELANLGVTVNCIGPAGATRITRGRLAGQRRGPARHRSGHPGRRREPHLDEGLDRRPDPRQRRPALGRHQARPPARDRHLRYPSPRPPLLTNPKLARLEVDTTRPRANFAGGCGRGLRRRGRRWGT
jgi:NAD(P)-dependent dehydrogenase (short-subunit alcohol dehydrogenase family)